MNPMMNMMQGMMGGGMGGGNNPMAMLMQMMQGGGNPQQLLMNMAQQNPQMKQVLDMVTIFTAVLQVMEYEQTVKLPDNGDLMRGVQTIIAQNEKILELLGK